MPNGKVYRANSFSGGVITDSWLQGVVAISYYTDPLSLVNVTADTPPVATVSWVDNRITLTPVAGFTGTTLVTITVNDGMVNVIQSFSWIIT